MPCVLSVPASSRAGYACGVGVNAGAAAEQRPKLYTRPDAQTAGSLRTHQALVAGEAEHVNVHALHVDRYRACRL